MEYSQLRILQKWVVMMFVTFSHPRAGNYSRNLGFPGSEPPRGGKIARVLYKSTLPGVSSTARADDNRKCLAYEAHMSGYSVCRGTI